MSGSARTSSRHVGRQFAVAMLSILSPAPNNATMTVSSVATSQIRGDLVGSSGAGMPGMNENAAAPASISSAAAAGSLPDTKRGSHNATMTQQPIAASSTS